MTGSTPPRQHSHATSAPRSTRPDPADSERLADAFEADDLDLSDAPGWTDPRLIPLIHGVATRTAADAAILEAVRSARSEGVPWTMVAAVLGVSHQAAMKRFKPLLNAPAAP